MRSKICFPTRLLGRHVIDRSDNRAGIGDAHGQGGIVGRTRGDRFRQAEIENLYAAVACDQDVIGLQIAMQDSRHVRGRESIRDLHG